MSRHSCLAVWPLAFWSCFSSCQCKTKCCTNVWMNRAEPVCKTQDFGSCGLLKRGLGSRTASLFSKPVCMESFKKVGCRVRGALANTETTTNVNIWIKSIWCNKQQRPLGALLPQRSTKALLACWQALRNYHLGQSRISICLTRTNSSPH